MSIFRSIPDSRMRDLILQNMWHYQRRHSATNPEKRWTFIFEEQHPLFSTFARVMLSLQLEGLVALAPNGQFALTSKGIEYCKSNVPELHSEDRFFDDYGIPSIDEKKETPPQRLSTGTTSS